MTTEKKPYRVLLQINDDGTLGSSVIFKQIYTDPDTGQVVNVTELPMKDTDTEGSEWDLSAILGEALAASLRTIEQLNKDLLAKPIEPPLVSVASEHPTRQAVELVLDDHGLYDAVMALIKLGGNKAMITFNNARYVHRDHPLVLAVIAAEIATAEQVDAMFAEALAMDKAG